MKIRVKTKHEFNGAVIGTLLGDACCQSFTHKITGKRKAYLVYRHKADHKEYVQWKNHLLSKYLHMHFCYNKNGENPAYDGRSARTKKLIYMYDDFYGKKRRKKLVTRRILNRLTPLGLAIWYMDDGSLKLNKKWTTVEKTKRSISSRNAILCTHSFGYEGNLIIKEYFKDVWNIEVRLEKNKNHYMIKMNTKNTKLFFDIIAPYVTQVKCMSYKVDMQYSKNNSRALENPVFEAPTTLIFG